MEACSFHRNEAARFQCYECGTGYCDTCASVRDITELSGKNRHSFCPVCNIPVQTIAVGNIIAPFWHRLSDFFLCPFQPTLQLDGHSAGVLIIFPCLLYFYSITRLKNEKNEGIYQDKSNTSKGNPLASVFCHYWQGEHKSSLDISRVEG